MGVGFVIPTTFLPTFTLDLGIERTGPFFIVYATTAFITRLATRRMPQTRRRAADDLRRPGGAGRQPVVLPAGDRASGD